MKKTVLKALLKRRNALNFEKTVQNEPKLEEKSQKKGKRTKKEDK